MKKIRGVLGLALILSIGLTGCQSTATGDDSANQQISSAAPTVTAVSKVHSTDYLGRWVSQSEQLVLYLNANQQLALFQSGHATIKGNFNLKLVNNSRATITQLDLGTATLTLNDANDMTLKTSQQTTQLNKDTGWSPKHSDMPTTTAAALKGASLTSGTPLKPDY